MRFLPVDPGPEPRAEPDCSMASPRLADQLGDAADGPPDRARRQAPDLGDVLVERRAVDPELVELLVEQLVGHAVEEQVDREDHDDEVVEPAEDRDVVRDEVAPEDQVAGRAGEQRLAVGRRPLVERRARASSRAYSGARLASGRNAMQRQRRARARRRRSSTRLLALRADAPCVRSLPPIAPGTAESTSRASRVAAPSSVAGVPAPLALTSNVRSV